MLTTAYLSAIAQILPLLMLTILVERQFLPRVPDTPKHQIFAVATDVFVGLTLLAFMITEARFYGVFIAGRRRPRSMTTYVPP